MPPEISFHTLCVNLYSCYIYNRPTFSFDVKSTTAFYLLIIYTLAVCKPVFPLLRDELAHIFWEADHIATVHHHHGELHAEEETATATHEEEKEKSPATSKVSEPVSIHVPVQSAFAAPQSVIVENIFGSGNDKAISLPPGKRYPPPKLL